MRREMRNTHRSPRLGFAATGCALLMLIVSFLPLRLEAVMVDPLSIEALAAQADIVLHGTVLSRTCQRDPAGRIYTRVEIAVSEVWKGAISGSPFVVVHGGGVLGERQSVVSFQVEYKIGEEVVAFLVRNERGEGVTLGLAQGKFHVWQDLGVKYATSPFHGGGAVRTRSAAAARSAGGKSGRDLLELARLKKKVQEVRR